MLAKTVTRFLAEYTKKREVKEMKEGMRGTGRGFWNTAQWVGFNRGSGKGSCGVLNFLNPKKETWSIGADGTRNVGVMAAKHFPLGGKE
jgi:hypothetical protein